MKMRCRRCYSMAKVGRPSKYRKDFHPEDFIRLSRQGKTFAQIAAAWDIDRETLWSWGKRHTEFANAIKRGRQLAEAWYMEIGQSAMFGQVKIDGRPVKVELGWYVWMTKNMFKWTDKIAVKDEKPNPAEDPLADLTDEELDAL